MHFNNIHSVASILGQPG